MILAAALLLAFMSPAASKTAHPLPYLLHPLQGDPFQPPSILQSEFGGDYARLAYVPIAESEQEAQGLLDAIPAPPQQDLTFENAGRSFKYLAVGDLSKPAKMIFVFVHGLGDNRLQGANEKLFGGSFARLRRLLAESDAIYLAPDFSGYGREAAGQVAALIADYAGRSPGAPVFVGCLSLGGGVCWRLAENAGDAPSLRGVLVFSAPVDRAFLNHLPSPPVKVYLAIGTKDAFTGWHSEDAFFRDIKAAAPDYPIRLTIFENGEHATAMRLTDWVDVLNWMLADSDTDHQAVPAIVARPPCPRPRPSGEAGRQPASYCGQP
jgi:hypothetical protein